jgi:hypothetical protein
MAAFTDPDGPVVQEMIAEIEALPPLTFELQPETALYLAGLLQLALRHPQLPPHSRDMARSLLESIREYFATAPTLCEVLRRGDREGG